VRSPYTRGYALSNGYLTLLSDGERLTGAHAGPMTGARKEPVVFVELEIRQDADDTVWLEWDRDTGETQIVVADIRDESLLVFPVPGANAGDAFRHPFRYAR
jgi:hypothetical protein